MQPSVCVCVAVIRRRAPQGFQKPSTDCSTDRSTHTRLHITTRRLLTHMQAGGGRPGSSNSISTGTSNGPPSVCSSSKPALSSPAAAMTTTAAAATTAATTAAPRLGQPHNANDDAVRICRGRGGVWDCVRAGGCFPTDDQGVGRVSTAAAIEDHLARSSAS